MVLYLTYYKSLIYSILLDSFNHLLKYYFEVLISNYELQMIHIPTPEEFSYQELLKFLSRNEKECLHSIKDNTIYKVLEIENDLILFSISYDNGLVVSIHTDNQSPEVQSIIRTYIEDWFDLNANLKTFY